MHLTWKLAKSPKCVREIYQDAEERQGKLCRYHQGEGVNQLGGENIGGRTKACRCLQYHDFPMEGLKSRPEPAAALISAKRAIIATSLNLILASSG